MEILATIPIYTYPWVYNALLVFGIIMVIVGIVCLSSITQFNSIIPFLIGLTLIVSGFTGVVHTVKAIDEIAVVDYNKYKVTIDEALGARDFLNKYEILSREGEIFTIKEIEVDE